ncbi:MAG: phage terminase large subunit family protein [Candidatus Freyarchaeota archaeon]
MSNVSIAGLQGIDKDLCKLSSREIKDLRELALEDLYFFARAIMGFDYMYKPLHYPLCQFLQDQTTKRKLAIMPRGFLKTSIVSQAYPIWLALRNPEERILIASNTAPNAERIVRGIMKTFETNPLIQFLFPEVIPDFGKKSRWSVRSAVLKRKGNYNEGTFEAIGRGGRVVGRHYTRIIQDDIVAPSKEDLTAENVYPTQEEIDQAIGWHKLAYPLLENPVENEMVITGTRWATYDHIGWIIQNEKGYKIFERSAIDENGNATYPTRFPMEVLDEIKATIGANMFAALYLNQPVADEFLLFRRDQFKYWKELPKGLRMVISVDPATGEKGRDKTAIVLCGHDDERGLMFVVEYINDWLDAVQTIEKIVYLVKKYKVIKVIIEKNAYQVTLAKFLDKYHISSSELGYYCRIEPVHTGRGGKDLRIHALQPLFEEGRVFLRSGMHELETQLLDYTPARSTGYDDLIDALSWQVYEVNLRKPVEPEPEPEIDWSKPILPTTRELLQTIEQRMPWWERRKRRLVYH